MTTLGGGGGGSSVCEICESHILRAVARQRVDNPVINIQCTHLNPLDLLMSLSSVLCKLSVIIMPVKLIGC